jgi:hypothetical protein
VGALYRASAGTSRVARRQLGSAVGANPIHQGYQPGAILISYCSESQAQAVVGNLMLYDGFGTNLSFGNQKIHLSFRTQGMGSGRRKEQSTDAQIANTRNIFDPCTSPADPQSLRGFHPRNEPSGIKRSQPSRCHTSPWGLRNCAREGEARPRDSRPWRTIVVWLRPRNPADTLSPPQGNT